MQRKMNPDPDRQRAATHRARKAGAAKRAAKSFKDGKGKERAAASKPKLGSGLGPGDPVAPDKKPGAGRSQKGPTRAAEKKKG